MCKKPKGLHNRIDKCMINLIEFINEHTNLFETIACCCGHNKYPMTILLKSNKNGEVFDLMSDITIPRKRNFYKKDKQGYYFIPEIMEVQKSK